MHIIAMKKRDRRRAPLGRAQSLQRVPGVEAPQPSSACSIPAVSRYPRRRGSRPTRSKMREHASAAIPFRYGIEENRPTWEQMALYTHQQGIAHRV